MLKTACVCAFANICIYNFNRVLVNLMNKLENEIGQTLPVALVNKLQFIRYKQNSQSVSFS